MEAIRWLLTVAEVEVSAGCGGVSLKLVGVLKEPKNLLNVA